MRGSCGCSEFRTRPAVVAPAPDPEPAKAVDPEPAPTPWRCDEHDLTFPNVQARSAHRRHHHKPPAAAKQGSASEDRSSAPVQSEEGPANTLTPGTATPEKKDPAPTEGDAPLGGAGQPDPRRHALTAHIDLDGIGHVHIEVQGLTRDEFSIALGVVHRAVHISTPIEGARP